MRRMLTGLIVIGTALLAMYGCADKSRIKANRPDPTYVLPPQDDPRFSNPTNYPKNTLNDFPKKDPNSDPDSPGGAGGAGGFKGGGSGGGGRFGAGGPGGGSGM